MIKEAVSSLQNKKAKIKRSSHNNIKSRISMSSIRGSIAAITIVKSQQGCTHNFLTPMLKLCKVN